MVQPIDWSSALSLEEYVAHLFQDGKTGSPEFKTLLMIYGRPKLVEFWEKYQYRKHAPAPGIEGEAPIASPPKQNIPSE